LSPEENPRLQIEESSEETHWHKACCTPAVEWEEWITRDIQRKKEMEKYVKMYFIKFFKNIFEIFVFTRNGC
jgi:hypothetical protein